MRPPMPSNHSVTAPGLIRLIAFGAAAIFERLYIERQAAI
jgi:hypothetical protein